MSKSSFNFDNLGKNDANIKDVLNKNTELQKIDEREKKETVVQEPAFLKKIQKCKFENRKQIYIDSDQIGKKISALASVCDYDIKDITNSILSNFFKQYDKDIKKYIQQKNEEQWS